MTNNEKRAHDLAIAMIPIEHEIFITRIFNESISEDDRFDVFKEYLRYYNAALEAFNRQFPEN